MVSTVFTLQITILVFFRMSFLQTGMREQEIGKGPTLRLTIGHHTPLRIHHYETGHSRIRPVVLLGRTHA